MIHMKLEKEWWETKEERRREMDEGDWSSYKTEWKKNLPTDFDWKCAQYVIGETDLFSWSFRSFTQWRPCVNFLRVHLIMNKKTLQKSFMSAFFMFDSSICLKAFCEREICCFSNKTSYKNSVFLCCKWKSFKRFYLLVSSENLQNFLNLKIEVEFAWLQKRAFQYLQTL